MRICPIDQNDGAPGGEAGMTLVEMIVVLAIVGIIAGAAALGIGTVTRGPNIEAEARRLADLMQLAADDVMINDRPLAITWNEKSYAFVAWDGGQWRSGVNEAFERHKLPSGMVLEQEAGRGPVPLGIDGMGMPLSVRLKSANDNWIVAYDGVSVKAIQVPPS